MIRTKRCTGPCGRELPLDKFYKHRLKKDGLSYRCRECIDLQQKEYYKENQSEVKRRTEKYRRKNPDKYAGYNKKFRNTIKGHLGQVYYALNYRCNNPKYSKYRDYGGRGIQNKFESLDDFRGYVANELKVDPRGLQIDRIDNDGHYEKGNIRFVTCTENNNNKRNTPERISR